MKKLYSLCCILAFSLVFAACSRDVVQDKPQNTLLLMQSAIDNQNYEEFQNYLLESKRGVYTKQDLVDLKDIGATGGAQLTHYYLCEYPNGEKVLFELTMNKVDGKYYIQDIIPITQKYINVFAGREGK